LENNENKLKKITEKIERRKRLEEEERKEQARKQRLEEARRSARSLSRGDSSDILNVRKI